jgi:hypothetical protein
MTALAMPSLGLVSTFGSSASAHYVAEQSEQGRRRLQDSFSLGLAGKGVFDELCAVAEECRTPNWDGYGAAPIRAQVLWQTFLFLESLPLGTPPPSVGAEPDGHLTLEWHHSPHRTLSVSISPDGDLHYASLLGLSKAYGTEPFFGAVPQVILDLIQRLSTS